ncbi:hypothetical protein QFC21_000294 [Naganishia friedmannii]|uniref:Uncharacterized protein n=1 Tax=Naganishia friedmannii TaxID=89922 RepID=A0ACC2WDN1_9TREE|nr:hypothetical protein QFC21_000294 [Naganishia friedmannii]
MLTTSNMFTPTRRELVLVITLTLVFTLIMQLEFSSNGSDGARGLRFTGRWPFQDSSGVQDDLHPGRTAHAFGQLTLEDADADWKQVLEEEGLLQRLYGTNDVGSISYEGVGRWKEVTMNDSMSKWGNKKAPKTEIVAHSPGWTIFRNLYLLNGTWYIVTENPSEYPLLRLMTSSGAEIWNDEESIRNREPTDKDMKFIFPSEAKRLFGGSASRVEGTTWMANDPPQFLDHYYHFAAELLFGLWRTYSTLDTEIKSDGISRLPSPRRLVFSHSDGEKWRDYSKMNTFLCKTVFPSMSYEFQSEFQDRADAGRVFIYDRVLFADRAAALRGPQFAHTWRTAAEAMSLPGSPYWWSPVRRNLLEFVGVPDSTLHPSDLETPVITYVSRQDWGRRMLIKEDHEKLVKELNNLHDKYGYEVNIVSMDKLTRDEQIRLSARTTIMLGVHGNGLTHLLWMKPTPRATVIEFFFPQGFAHDYEFTSRALGVTHYGFWGSEYFTHPDTPKVAYPEGFQGNEIPIDGKVVADLIHARLSIPVEEVEETKLDRGKEDNGVVLNDEDDDPVMEAIEEAELSNRKF